MLLSTALACLFYTSVKSTAFRRRQSEFAGQAPEIPLHDGALENVSNQCTRLLVPLVRIGRSFAAIVRQFPPMTPQW